MEFINFLIEADWSRTRVPSMFYLTLLVGSFISFIINICNTIGRKSKELYFQIYCIAAYLVVFQCMVLLSVDSSSFFQLTTILAFVYATAILILFLIFLALVTSEVFYEKAHNNTTIKITEISLASLALIWILTLNIICFIYTLEDMSKLTKTKILIMNWLNQHDNKNIVRVNYKAEVINKYGIEFWKELGAYEFKDYQKPKTEKKKINISTEGIFYYLKKEVIDEYITYSASALLQGLCLILVILLLI